MDRERLRKVMTAFILIVALAIWGRFLWLYGVGETDSIARDFPSYYFAARLAFEDQLSPYSQSAWNKAAEVYKSRYFENEKLWPYLYPPPSLLLFRILPELTFQTAKTLFLIFNHLLLLVFSYILLFRVFALKNKSTLIILGFVFLLFFKPLITTIKLGQINILIALLLVVFWYLLKNQKKAVVVALPLAIAALIKVTPIIMCFYLLARKKYKVFIWVILLIGIISLLSLPALPGGIWDSYRNMTQNIYGGKVLIIHPGSLENQSINGFTSRLFIGRNLRIDILYPDEAAARKVPLIINAAVLLISFLLVFADTYLLEKVRTGEKGRVIRAERRACRNLSLDEGIGFSLFLLTMYLVSPISWEHHLVFLIPAIFFVLRMLLSQKFYIPIFFWLLPIVVFLGSDYNFNNPAFHHGYKTLLISAKFSTILIFWIGVIIYLVKKNMISLELARWQRTT